MLDEIRRRSSTRWEALVATHPELDESFREQRSLGPSQVSAAAHRWVSSWTPSNEGTYRAGVAGVDVPPGQEESLCATADLVSADDAPIAFLELVPRDWMKCFLHAPQVATVQIASRPAAADLKYLVVRDRDQTLVEGRWARTLLGGYVWRLDLDPGTRRRQWAAVAVRTHEVKEQRGHASAPGGWVDKVGEGTATVGRSGSARAGMKGTAIAGDRGKAEAGHMGRATAGHCV